MCHDVAFMVPLSTVPTPCVFSKYDPLFLGRRGTCLGRFQPASGDRLASRDAHVLVQQAGVARLDVDTTAAGVADITASG
jgi:hypothetical protein